MAELRTNVRVKAEGLAITVKTLVTFLVLVYDTRRGEIEGTLALLAFAGGQMAYGITALLTYLAYYGVRDAWPKTSWFKYVRLELSYFYSNRSSRRGWHTFDPESLRLALTMTSQSLVKLLLTEGDKLILSWFSPLQDQGGYALAVNYGRSFPPHTACHRQW
jgi:oligosaccharide translocation protein RFT1